MSAIFDGDDFTWQILGASSRWKEEKKSKVRTKVRTLDHYSEIMDYDVITTLEKENIEKLLDSDDDCNIEIALQIVTIKLNNV